MLEPVSRPSPETQWNSRDQNEIWDSLTSAGEEVCEKLLDSPQCYQGKAKEKPDPEDYVLPHTTGHKDSVALGKDTGIAISIIECGLTGYLTNDETGAMPHILEVTHAMKTNWNHQNMAFPSTGSSNTLMAQTYRGEQQTKSQRQLSDPENRYLLSSWTT